MRLNQVFIILCCFCFGALIAIWLYALEHQTPKTQIVNNSKALIGGPFNLIDHKGVPKTDKDFQGKYMLIYFGYSFCPDICPTDLQKMTRAIELAKPKSDKVQPIFITIDPERDTPKQLAGYVSNFHPRLVGLTGTLEEITKAKKAYKVYGIKVDENGKPSKNITGDDYLMDHSPQTFLIGPDGKFIRYFRFNNTDKDMATAINKHVK